MMNIQRFGPLLVLCAVLYAFAMGCSKCSSDQPAPAAALEEQRMCSLCNKHPATVDFFVEEDGNTLFFCSFDCHLTHREHQPDTE